MLWEKAFCIGTNLPALSKLIFGNKIVFLPIVSTSGGEVCFQKRKQWILISIKRKGPHCLVQWFFKSDSAQKQEHPLIRNQEE